MMSSQPVSGLESGNRGTSNIQDLRELGEYNFNQQYSNKKVGKSYASFYSWSLKALSWLPFEVYNCGHETPGLDEPPVIYASSCSDPLQSVQLFDNMSEPMISNLPVRCPVCGEDKIALPANLPATPRLRRPTGGFYTHPDISKAQNGDIVPVFEEVPTANVVPVFGTLEEDTSEFGSGMNRITSRAAAMLLVEMRLPFIEEINKMSHVVKPIMKSTTSILRAGAHEMGRQIHQVDKAPILARLDKVQSSLQKTDIPTPLTTTIWNSFARTVVKQAKGVVATQQRKDEWIDRAGDEDVDIHWDNLEDVVESDPEILKEKSHDWELCN